MRTKTSWAETPSQSVCPALLAFGCACPQEALSAGRGRVVLAVLDHVVSFPPLLMPLRELAAVCKKVGRGGPH